MRESQVQAALARLPVRLAPRGQRLAAQRRRHTEQRIANRVAALGFVDVGAYLADRVLKRRWPLADMAAELMAHRLTVRRLLDHHGIGRVRPTPRSGRRRVRGVGCRRWGGGRVWRCGWRSSASRI